MKKAIPRVVLVLFLLATAQIVRAQEGLPDLVRRVKPSVVSVLTYDTKDQSLISGTGFFVRPGEVVTNLHVIRGAHRVEIHTLDGKGRTYQVKGTLAVDDEADVALLSVTCRRIVRAWLPSRRACPKKARTFS